MPGLTVTLGPDAPATLSALRSHALEGVSSVQAGSVETILETPRAAALLTAYDSYPRRRLVTRDVLIFVEGFVDADDAELRRIVEGIVNSDSKRQEEALRELRTRDGEFVLLVHQEHDGRTWILNDSYGHLPLYRVDRGSGTLLSRDFGLACRFAGPATPNPCETAAFLAFTFVPVHGTLHPVVRDVDVGTVVTSDGLSIDTRHWCTRNAGSECGRGDDPVRPTDVAEALLRATRVRQREAPRTSIMSLSGGLDSRAIAACLRQLGGRDVQAVTFRDRRGTATKDLEPARLVAEVAGLPWQLIDLDDPDAGDESELFRLKRGMNSLRMSFILPFFRRLIDDFGPDLTYFTGDSGLALRSLLPRRRPRDAKEFVDAVFAARGRYHRHPVYHPDTACRIAGVSRDDFDRWLIEEITVGRSEMGWAELFLWFTLEGYGRRWHYEGMDRNRHFFWLAAPLEATPVLDLVSRVQDSKKKDFSFYGAVLRELDPELGNIPKAGQRFAPGSLPQRARGRLTILYQSLPTPLVQRLREVRGKGLQPVAPDTFPLGQLRQRWESSPTSRAHFDLSSLLDGCDTERCYSAADSLLSFWEFVDGIR